jgi:recombination protein RecR
MHKENDLDSLIKLFSKLPSLGPRSARRIVLHLINNRQNIMFPLMESMKMAKENIKNCEVCGNLDSKNICGICANPNRSNGLLCVVEEVSDLWAMEKGGIFSGKYHILGGVLSAINGKGPEDLNIDKLISRIKDENIEEVILATNSTIEGQTTAYYLSETLKEFGIKISKLAHGIPIGSELDYLDEGTLSIAFKLRSNF